MKRVLAGSLLLLSPAMWANTPTDITFIPAVGHLEGVGDIFGAGVSAENVGKSDIRITAGVAGGDVEAAGFAISDVTLGRGSFTYAFVNVGEATVDTQYGRGFATLTPYQQELSGNAHLFGYKLPSATSDALTWETGLAITNVEIGDYFEANGERIQIDAGALSDISSVIINGGAKWDTREASANGLKTGFKANAGLTLTTGRSAQSDQGQIDYGFSQHIALADPLLLSLYVKGSHAFIISRDEAHDDLSEITSSIKTNCSTGTPAQQASCNQWKGEVAEYIRASNTKGTAKGLGGSTGLRSYQEQYFRSANQLLEGVEAQYVLPFAATQKLNLQWVSFLEFAQSHDDLNSLTDSSNHSVGTGLRAYVNDIPLRLEYADGEAGDAWYLTAGLVW